MASRVRVTWIWVGVAFVLGASAAGFFKSTPAANGGRHGIASHSGFVMMEADRRKSRAYLNFMYGLLYQERGQRDKAEERFAEACALDRVLQPGLESELNPS